MSIDQLKQEIKTLSGDERHELASFLVQLELDEDPGYWKRVRARMADRRPERWVDVAGLDPS